MSWFTESNRWKHFVCAIPAAFLLTFLFAFGLGCGMEFKDWRFGQGRWDWLDLLATILGGLTGQALQCLVIGAIFSEYTYFGI